VDVQVVAWDGAAFAAGNTAGYAFDGDNWQPVVGEPVA
jgi:hypothetical protein